MEEKSLYVKVQEKLKAASKEVLEVALIKAVDVSTDAVGMLMESVHERKTLGQLSGLGTKTISEEELREILVQVQLAKAELDRIESSLKLYADALQAAAVLARKLRHRVGSPEDLAALESALLAIDPELLEGEAS